MALGPPTAAREPDGAREMVERGEVRRGGRMIGRGWEEGEVRKPDLVRVVASEGVKMVAGREVVERWVWRAVMYLAAWRGGVSVAGVLMVLHGVWMRGRTFEILV